MRGDEVRHKEDVHILAFADFDDNTLLQPAPNLGPPRSLNARDDMPMTLPMTLLDRSYVMSHDEEMKLVEESCRHMGIFLENAVSEQGWSSRGKLGGTKIASKEGVDGSA